ncbi:Superfamily I DNA and/or RNA helicase [Marivirga sericea]|uniref:Superfamily I DNA and/or RNA helicase n=1 Tax=Marivirga sericea TaxID=1028 RepID=A0A1X7J3B8_9BACT|nr:ATP-binding protein [Marivirga sericea]SMG21311.1 Superfamily I DNA and/or RNA helicase [Marivirga sericea]
MHDILRHYLKRLTNLSGTNRSLLLLRLISDQTLDLHDFDFLLNKSSFSLIEDLIARKKHIPLAAVSDSRLELNNIMSQKLKKLKRIEKFIYDERGAKDLYVGWPFVRGKFHGGTSVRCPLIFFPIEIKIVNDQWVMELREDVNITFNKSFLLAYAHFHGIKISDELIEKVFEIYDQDSRVFRTDLYQIFKESAVELNFNQDNFMDVLHPFKNFKKTDFEETEKEGELKLFPEAAIGIFPQSGSYLVPDYSYMLDKEQEVQDIEEFFLSRNPDKQADDPSDYSQRYRFIESVKEEETFSVFPMDAYQENALKAVKKGNSLVVQGPPGTGKSQLISNLVTDFIARGKRVLVVCQKRAALDVIYDRMKSIDMQPFMALVHDFKNDRKAIFEQIQNQIDRIEEYESKNNGLDSVQIQREFLKSSRIIDQIVEEKEEYRLALFDESECGISAKELYLNCDFNETKINLKQIHRHFHKKKIEEFANTLVNFQTYVDDFSKDDFIWQDRVNFKDFGLQDKTEIVHLLERIPAYFQDTTEKSKNLVGSSMSLKEFEDVVEHQEKLNNLGELLNTTSYPYLIYMFNYPDDNTNALWLSNVQRVINDCFKDGGIESSLASKDLGTLQKTIQLRRQSRKRPTKWIHWLLFAKEKFFLKKVLVANNLTVNNAGIKELEKRLDNRLNFEHNMTKLKKQTWLKEIPETKNQIELNHWFQEQTQAIKAKEIIGSFTNFKAFSLIEGKTLAEFLDKISAIIELSRATVEEKNKWKKYLTRTQIDQLEQERLPSSYIKTFQRYFDELVHFDQLYESLEDYEKEVVKLLNESDITIDHKNIKSTFLNSIYLEWIDHIETKHPILREVSTRKFDKQTDDLQYAIENKLQLSTEILNLKVRERTFSNVEYNRLSNRITYRDLSHQVTKKRQIWPIRKVIQEFQDELFDLIPCWMASPESVSAIFPMEEIFDLVIFDEASQCFVEKGIPAMYRGKQVVVAGDDKQLSPNDLYKVRWEEEEVDHPDLEIDSLLDLANKYVMNLQLSGHYRSKSLDLIEFSNHHFYKDRLRLLPDFHYINNADPGIDYIKVDGIWEQNANEVEALNVVDLIKEYLKNDPEKEIGVVTFNAPQQGLIWDILEDQIALGNITLPDKFFVKNIENVQGDEKDIIIFSTGYAADKAGRLRMQFGSINAPKGENRLNVAITRAREKVVIVSSLYPDQLKVDDAKNNGPKLLKAYLHYALDVSKGNFKPKPKPSISFQSSWFLKTKVREELEGTVKSIKAEEELPFADLSFKSNNQYKGLLLSDDNLFYDNPSVKDIFAYTPFLLSKMNWPYIQIKSRNFWNDKEELMERVVQFAKRND